MKNNQSKEKWQPSTYWTLYNFWRYTTKQTLSLELQVFASESKGTIRLAIKQYKVNKEQTVATYPRTANNIQTALYSVDDKEKQG